MFARMPKDAAASFIDRGTPVGPDDQKAG